MADEESYHENEDVESNIEQKNLEKKDKNNLNQSSSTIKSKSKLNNSKMSNENEQPVKIESTRTYLDNTVTAVVQQGMLELVRQNPKPENPLKFLGEYILKEAKKK